jgi:type VI secretion system protein ImpK
MTGLATDLGNNTAAPRRPDLPLERLALIYEDIFTVIVRVQTGKQQIERADSFRERVKSVLKSTGQAARHRGYSADDVQHANFAVVAFLDETVLASSETVRSEWARKTLQEELFHQRSAGELFFQQLDQLRACPDSPELIQVLEIYYLCLLLGYEGKYAVGSKAELYLLMDNVRERIEHVSKYSPELSADARAELRQDAGPALPADPVLKWTRLLAVAAAGFALICFIAFKIALLSQTADVHALLSRLSPSGL